MSKKKNKKKQSDRSALIIVGIGLLGIVIVGALLASGMAGSTQVAASAQTITPADYQAQFSDAQHFLLDVRTPDEFASGYIAGATNISVQNLADRLAEVPTDQPIVVYCRSGNRSAQAVTILRDAGYTDVYDLGGINAWTAAGLPVQ